MTNRFPLTVNSTTNQISELASGENLDLTGSSIVNGSATLTLPSTTGTLALTSDVPSAFKTVNGASILGSGNIATGDVTLSGIETLTNKTITAVVLKETKVTLANGSIDLATGNYFTKTISGATTFTLSNVPASGTAVSFILDLTNGGSATVTWWSNVKWAGGTAPTLTSAGRDSIGFYTYDNGTTWTGLVLGKDIK